MAAAPNVTVPHGVAMAAAPNASVPRGVAWAAASPAAAPNASVPRGVAWAAASPAAAPNASVPRGVAWAAASPAAAPNASVPRGVAWAAASPAAAPNASVPRGVAMAAASPAAAPNAAAPHAVTVTASVTALPSAVAAAAASTTPIDDIEALWSQFLRSRNVSQFFLVYPTGSGKTRKGALLMQRMVATGYVTRVIAIVPRMSLKSDSAVEYAKIFEEQRRYRGDYHRMVTVLTRKEFVRALDIHSKHNANEVFGVFVDEFHTLISRSNNGGTSTSSSSSASSSCCAASVVGRQQQHHEEPEEDEDGDFVAGAAAEDDEDEGYKQRARNAVRAMNLNNECIFICASATPFFTRFDRELAMWVDVFRDASPSAADESPCEQADASARLFREQLVDERRLQDARGSCKPSTDARADESPSDRREQADASVRLSREQLADERRLQDARGSRKPSTDARADESPCDRCEQLADERRLQDARGSRKPSTDARADEHHLQTAREPRIVQQSQPCQGQQREHAHHEAPGQQIQQQRSLGKAVPLCVAPKERGEPGPTIRQPQQSDRLHLPPRVEHHVIGGQSVPSVQEKNLSGLVESLGKFKSNQLHRLKEQRQQYRKRHRPRPLQREPRAQHDGSRVERHRANMKFFAERLVMPTEEFLRMLYDTRIVVVGDSTDPDATGPLEGYPEIVNLRARVNVSDFPVTGCACFAAGGLSGGETGAMSCGNTRCAVARLLAIMDDDDNNNNKHFVVAYRYAVRDVVIATLRELCVSQPRSAQSVSKQRVSDLHSRVRTVIRKQNMPSKRVQLQVMRINGRGADAMRNCKWWLPSRPSATQQQQQQNSQSQHLQQQQQQQQQPFQPVWVSADEEQRGQERQRKQRRRNAAVKRLQQQRYAIGKHRRCAASAGTGGAASADAGGSTITHRTFRIVTAKQRLLDVYYILPEDPTPLVVAVRDTFNANPGNCVLVTNYFFCEGHTLRNVSHMHVLGAFPTFECGTMFQALGRVCRIHSHDVPASLVRVRMYDDWRGLADRINKAVGRENVIRRGIRHMLAMSSEGTAARDTLTAADAHWAPYDGSVDFSQVVAPYVNCEPPSLGSVACRVGRTNYSYPYVDASGCVTLCVQDYSVMCVVDAQPPRTAKHRQTSQSQQLVERGSCKRRSHPQQHSEHNAVVAAPSVTTNEQLRNFVRTAGLSSGEIFLSGQYSAHRTDYHTLRRHVVDDSIRNPGPISRKMYKGALLINMPMCNLRRLYAHIMDGTVIEYHSLAQRNWGCSGDASVPCHAYDPGRGEDLEAEGTGEGENEEDDDDDDDDDDELCTRRQQLRRQQRGTVRRRYIDAIFQWAQQHNLVLIQS